ncbi:MAG TPA: SCO family protein [Acidobacteriaceae bacterium]|jgi:protein SCO1/2|nr:SCO family protein [Acidobacteriaceae bacterium]
MRKWTGALAAIALAALCVPAQAQSQWFGFQKPGQPADQQPLILRKISIQQKINTQLPLNLAFRDETGKTVELGDYFGKKPVILSLVYYQCKILCPEEIDGLVGALEMLKFNAGKDFNVVLVSIDPTETPAIAAREKAFYMKRYGRPQDDNGWHFLTGEEPSIRTLATAVGFGYVPMAGPDGKMTQFAHASAIELATPQGKLAQYYLGVEFSPKDLQLGLVEASHGTIGSLVDDLMTYCFRYDPAQNGHTLLYIRIIQAGGALTVLTLGLFMFVSFRRDIREARAQKLARIPRQKTHLVNG